MIWKAETQEKEKKRRLMKNRRSRIVIGLLILSLILTLSSLTWARPQEGAEEVSDNFAKSSFEFISEGRTPRPLPINLPKQYFHIVSDEPFNTIVDGPMNALVVEIDDASDDQAVNRAIKDALWRAKGTLDPDIARDDMIDIIVMLMEKGKLLLPDLEMARMGMKALGDPENEIHLVFLDWEPADEDAWYVFFYGPDHEIGGDGLGIYPLMKKIYGSPGFDITVTVIRDNDMPPGVAAYTIPARNEVHMPDFEKMQEWGYTLDQFRQVLVHELIHDFHDDLVFAMDAWEEGFTEGASVMAMNLYKYRDDPNTLETLHFGSYDSWNQPGIGGCFRFSYFGIDRLARERYDQSAAAWQKVVLGYPNFWKKFNAQYYQDAATAPYLPGDTPALKKIAANYAPIVEGLAFYEWYGRQYILNTSPPPNFTDRIFINNLPQPLDSPSSLPTPIECLPEGEQGLSVELFCWWTYDQYEIGNGGTGTLTFTDAAGGEIGKDTMDFISGNNVIAAGGTTDSNCGFYNRRFYAIPEGLDPQRIKIDLDVMTEFDTELATSVYYEHKVYENKDAGVYGCIVGEDGGEVTVFADTSATATYTAEVSKGVFELPDTLMIDKPQKLNITYALPDGNTTSWKRNTGYEYYRLQVWPQGLSAILQILGYPEISDGYIDDQGNFVEGDGDFSSGDVVRVNFKLTNVGTADAQGVVIDFSEVDKNLYPMGHIEVGDFPVNAIGEATVYFIIEYSAPDKYTLPIKIKATDVLSREFCLVDTSVVITDKTPPIPTVVTTDPKFVPVGSSGTITVEGLIDGSGVALVKAILEDPTGVNPDVEIVLTESATAQGGVFTGSFTPPVEGNWVVDISTKDGVGNKGNFSDMAGMSSRELQDSADLFLILPPETYDIALDAVADVRDYYQDALKANSFDYEVWDSWFRGNMDIDVWQGKEYRVTIWVAPVPGATSLWDPSLVDGLKDYMSKGGRLFITGQDIGWAAYEGHIDAEFYEKFLSAKFIEDSSSDFCLVGTDIIGDIPLTIEGGDGADNQEYPSVIDTVDPARDILSYATQGGIGALRVDRGWWKTVYLAFGYEAIDNATDRNLVMKKIIDWLLAVNYDVGIDLVATDPYPFAVNTSPDILVTVSNQGDTREETDLKIRVYADNSPVGDEQTIAELKPHESKVLTFTGWKAGNTSKKVTLKALITSPPVEGEEDLVDNEVILEVQAVSTDTVPPVITRAMVNPNIFTPDKYGTRFTTLSFSLSEPSLVTVGIYDKSENLVKILADKEAVEKGSYSTTWDGASDQGQIVAEGVYTIKIEAQDILGNQSNPIQIEVEVVSGAIKIVNLHPSPNPYNPDRGALKIIYTLTVGGHDIEVRIYNTAGELIRELSEIGQPYGDNYIEWDGTDEDGETVLNGLYIFQIRATDVDNNTASKIETIVVIK